MASVPPLKLSLAEALRIAKQRHVEILVADARIEQALARISQERSALLPQFSGEISQYRKTINLEAYGIGQGFPNFNSTPPPFNVFDARIYLTQTLFDPNVLARLKAAKMGHFVSEAEKRKTEEDALALVANLYLEAERSQEALRFAQSQLRRDTARLNDAQSRSQLGLGSAIEVTQARAALEGSRHQIEVVRAEAEERRLDLLAALGMDPSGAVEFSSPAAAFKNPPPSEAEIAELVTFHPEVTLAQRRVEQAEFDRKTQHAAYYPKLTGSADYGASGLNPGQVDDTYSFGGQVQIPIYSGGLTQARVREASAKIKESQVRLEQTERDQMAKAKSALASLRQAQSGLKAADAELIKTSRELSLSQEKLQEGLGNPLEVTEAQTASAQAQDQQSEARATYRLAWVNLFHALGTMDRLIEERKEP